MRRELRRPIEVSGWIIGDDGQSNPCTVSNLSSKGAKLTVLNREDLPEEFDVSLAGAKHRSRPDLARETARGYSVHVYRLRASRPMRRYSARRTVLPMR